ncbi:hypothetical protein BX600DRAFT_507325 [Xylariales sp. PMI_506]|nr:hypothetical protein BX600DRAFT_507325 [Xylariales sp. PMI_506]
MRSTTIAAVIAAASLVDAKPHIKRDCDVDTYCSHVVTNEATNCIKAAIANRSTAALAACMHGHIDILCKCTTCIDGLAPFLVEQSTCL